MNSNAIKFLNTLFNENDFIVVGNKYQTNHHPCSMDEAIHRLKKMNPTCDGVFVSLNPLKSPEHGLKQENVSNYRNFLIEMDGVDSVGQQLDYIQTSRIPYTSLVFSGNKSVHLVIALNETVPTLKMYQEIHQALRLKLGGLADAGTVNHACTTKVPGFLRISKNDGQITTQHLIDLRDRIDLDILFESIEEELFQVRMRILAERRLPSSSGIFADDISILNTYLDEFELLEKASYSSVHVQCPLCAKEGYDTSKDNLSICLNIGKGKPLAKCWAGRGHEYIDIINYLKKGGSP